MVAVAPTSLHTLLSTRTGSLGMRTIGAGCFALCGTPSHMASGLFAGFTSTCQGFFKETHHECSHTLLAQPPWHSMGMGADRLDASGCVQSATWLLTIEISPRIPHHLATPNLPQPAISEHSQILEAFLAFDMISMQINLPRAWDVKARQFFQLHVNLEVSVLTGFISL